MSKRLTCPYCGITLKLGDDRRPQLRVRCTYCYGVFTWMSASGTALPDGERTHYELLGLPADADARSIKKRFRELAFKFHPDRNPDRQEQATAWTQALNEACGVLSDEEKRREYDRALAEQQAATPPVPSGGEDIRVPDFVRGNRPVYRGSYSAYFARTAFFVLILVFLSWNGFLKDTRKAPDRRLVSLAEMAGVDTAAVERSAARAEKALAVLAARIRKRLPLTAQNVNPETGSAFYQYRLDRASLDEAEVRRCAAVVEEELARTAKIAAAAGVTLETLPAKDYEIAPLQNSLIARLDHLRRILFNLRALEGSIIFDRELASGAVSEGTLRRLRGIGTDPLLAAWLKRSGALRRCERLGPLLDACERAQRLRGEIELLERSGKPLPQRYDSLVREYNRAAAAFDPVKMERAFNDCLEASLLLPDFNIVDLRSGDNA